jgi:ketosteroid isomerase-like protein
MPQNLPTAAAAWEDVTFFSIDTNLIQAAGYNFAQGALHQLPKQLPESVGLQLPEIVVSEIVKHRMESVHKAHKLLESAADGLHRLTTIDVSEVRGSIERLNAINAATLWFTQQVNDYAVQCRGAVLPTAGADAVESLFADYFAQKSPFGLSEKKKSEFPDAMCLWQLEQYAKDNDTIGIIASDDKGWKQFAAESEMLYCAGSIDELTALFAATNEHAESIKTKIAAAVEDVAAIEQRYQAWMKAIRERDLDGILGIYADHATYMPPGSQKASGTDALRKIWGGYLQREDFVALYTPTIHVSDAGDMAYDIGHYKISMKKEGKPVSFEGKYVVVWQLIDAQWRAVLDMDTMRTARSRTSGENFFDFVMAQSSQRMEPHQNPGRFILDALLCGAVQRKSART